MEETEKRGWGSTARFAGGLKPPHSARRTPGEGATVFQGTQARGLERQCPHRVCEQGGCLKLWSQSFRASSGGTMSCPPGTRDQIYSWQKVPDSRLRTTQHGGGWQRGMRLNTEGLGGWGTSLAVQWLRLRASTAGGTDGLDP